MNLIFFFKRLIEWTSSSLLPVIQHLLSFRRAPLSGVGEDWVEIVIPHQSNPVQSYLLRGLASGTSYQARLRTRTRSGLSSLSPTLTFTTWSPWPILPPQTPAPRQQTKILETTEGRRDESYRRDHVIDFAAYSSGWRAGTLTTLLSALLSTVVTLTTTHHLSIGFHC